MSIDQENVFNDQQSDNGVFAVETDDRSVPSKKEPSKAKNTKILIYSMIGLFVVAVCGVGAIAVNKLTKSSKPHDDMTIQVAQAAINALPTNTDIIEPTKPAIIGPQIKTAEALKPEPVQTTSPSMPNAVVDINSIPVEKREPEVNRGDFNALQQRVSTLEALLKDQIEKSNKLESKFTDFQSSNSGKLINTASAKKTTAYIAPKKRVVKHKKEAVVDDSILFEPSSLAQPKTAPTPPAEPAGRIRGEYKLKAIVEDRVWLEDPQGNSITVTQGDAVSGLGNLTAVDEHDFKVRFSTGTTLKGQ